MTRSRLNKLHGADRRLGGAKGQAEPVDAAKLASIGAGLCFTGSWFTGLWLRGKQGKASTIARACPVLVVLALLCACNRGTLEGTTYRKTGMQYRIGPLSGAWAPVQAKDNDLAWRHTAGDGLIQVNGRCGDGLDIPLKALLQHLLIGFTEVDTIAQENKTLDRREALDTKVTARLDGVPVALWLVVMKKDGCAYDFAHVASSPEAWRAADFQAFLDGFRSIKGASE